MDPELFESSFFELYQNFGFTCLSCTSLHLEVNHKPGEPMQVTSCKGCGKSVEEQMEHWSAWHRHLLIWDLESDERHVHSTLTFGTLDTFLQIVPMQFQVLFLDQEHFLKCNQLAALTGSVPDACLCPRCEVRSQAVKDIQQWCAAIKDEEEKKDDYSDFYFMASKLSKSLHLTLQDNFFRRIILTNVQNPYAQEVKDIPVALLEQVNKKCVICTKGFKERGELFVFPYCQHVFHVQCTEAWLGTRESCPLCREPLRK